MRRDVETRASLQVLIADCQFPGKGSIMAKAYHIRCLLGCLACAWVAGTGLLGSAIAQAVPYPLPPGYLGSYDQGFDTMAPRVGSKYTLTPSSQLTPICYDELRIAQVNNPPQNAQGFMAGCITAARHAMGIYYRCDRDDPVCARRP
jgi:hypothetical protein